MWRNGANCPEPHTDFIFAVTGEELGLAGTLSVLALFAALGYAGIRVAGRTEDPFVRYAAGGVTTWITAQAVINIGAVLGLLPIAGVPLPLFSYGGSALLPTMFAIGLLIAFARSEPAARAALADAAAAAVRGPRPGLRWKTMRRRVTAAVRPESGEFRCMSYSPAGGPPATSSPRSPSRTPCAGRTRPWGSRPSARRRGLETRLVPERGYELALIPAVPLPRKPTPELITVPGRLRGTIKAAEQILERTKADCVVGFGGYVALPGYLAAKRLGVPIVVHEANARPGLANKIGSRYAHAVAVSTPDSKLRDARYIGIPLRRTIATLDRAAVRPEARAAFGLDPNLPTLLVSGGSQGARRLNEVVQRGRPGASSSAGIQILHAVGPKNELPQRRTTCPGCRRTSRYRTWTGWTSRTPRPT